MVAFVNALFLTSVQIKIVTKPKMRFFPKMVYKSYNTSFVFRSV